MNEPLISLEHGMAASSHRGHNGGGVAILMDQERFEIEKAFTLEQLFHQVGDVTEKIIAQIGHTRWPTSGDNNKVNMQPHYKGNPGYEIAVCANGDLVNMKEQVAFLTRQDIKILSGNDGEMMCGSIYWQLDKQYKQKKSMTPNEPVKLGKGEVIQAIQKTMKHIKGAYSALFLATFDQALYAFRDPYGFRPMMIGLKGSRYVVCSETCQLDAVGARFLREVNPGEIIRISELGLESFIGQKSEQKAFCSFEMLYFLRPDSSYFYEKHGAIKSVAVDEVRYQIGRQLGFEIKSKIESGEIKIDMVIGVPRSGRPAAMGLAYALGLPQREGLIIKPTSQVGRTFIEFSEMIRYDKARRKYKFIKEIVKGKRILLVDDSLIRGLTMETLVQMAYEAGAKEVYVAIAAPEYIYPCYYGSDTKEISKLTAHDKNNGQLIQAVGCPTGLIYISLAGFKKVINRFTNGTCFACFDGNYVVPITDLE